MASVVSDSVAPCEWLSIVETQQRELQQLRAQVTSLASTPERPNSSDGDDARSAFAPSPTRSSTSRSSSSSSTRRQSRNSYGEASEAIPLDLQRYAKVCGDLEAARQRLTLKDARHRELRARANHMKLEIEHYRQRFQDSEVHVQALRAEVESEQAAKQEAVDRAAHAMVQSEELTRRLSEAVREAEALRTELRRHSDLTREVERRHSKTHDEATSNREAIARLESALMSLQAQNKKLDEQLQSEQEMRVVHVCVSDVEGNLRSRVEELERILALQTAQLERQQQVIVELHTASAMLEDELIGERKQHQTSVTQQLRASMSLQHIVDSTTVELRALKTQLAESEERVLMQDEEIAAYVAWRRSARQRDCQRETTLNDVCESKEKMERAVRLAEASRRRAIMELAETKRQLGQLQTAMAGVDKELQRMSKAFGDFRTRESNVSRTLREYSRRNRVLLDAVRLMSSKVLVLSESLQRSEKRKQHVLVQSHELQRGLVIERCQRQDLLQQCAELEACLCAFQRAACESTERAQSVEKENAVLQHAVQQLCAYSREISQSQRTLQSELTQLEVAGRREPQVFG